MTRMAKLEIPVRVYMGELEEIINELKHLQTYKLFEGDDMVLVDCDKVVEIFADHLRAEILSDSTIEPERKKGKWIHVMNGRGGHCCNRCYGYAPSYMNGNEHLSDFCPNCGSDMRGDQDE